MKSFGVAVVMVLLVSRNSVADLVYTTFGGSPPEYSLEDGATVAGLDSEFPLELGEQFVPTADVFVDTVDLAISFPVVLPLGASVTVSIVPNISSTDLPNTNPAVQLASVTVPLPANVSDAIVTADFNSIDATIGPNGGQLSPGSAYWVLVSTDGANEFIWADSSDEALESYQGSSINGGLTWTSQFRSADAEAGFPPLAAFSVHGTPTAVPEPSAAGFFLIASVLSLASVSAGKYSRRRRERTS